MFVDYIDQISAFWDRDVEKLMHIQRATEKLDVFFGKTIRAN